MIWHPADHSREVIVCRLNSYLHWAPMDWAISVDIWCLENNRRVFCIGGFVGCMSYFCPTRTQVCWYPTDYKLIDKEDKFFALHRLKDEFVNFNFAICSKFSAAWTTSWRNHLGPPLTHTTTPLLIGLFVFRIINYWKSECPQQSFKIELSTVVLTENKKLTRTKLIPQKSGQQLLKMNTSF